MDELLPLTQEIAIQTQKPRSTLVEDKEILITNHQNIPGVEIGIQVNEKPREVSTQTFDVPKTVSTSTEDLVPTVPRKSGPKSPQLPAYESQSMYGQIRDIIEEESNPGRSATKTDSGYHGDGESRFESFDDDLDSVLGDLENEIYVLYMQTEDGAIIGPLKLVINDATFSGPNQVAGATQGNHSNILVNSVSK
jgi:hypothetical protein